MKKIICFVLTFLLILSMCACGGTEKNEELPAEQYDGLQAGFGRVDITPDFSVRMAGGAATRTSEGFADRSYITCIAVKNDGQTFLLCTMDFICAEDVFVDPAKALMSQTTGVPEENILMNATHTHSGVAIRTNGWDGVERYREFFYGCAANAAQAAIADLSPAEVYTGSTQTEGLAYIRHYKVADGTYAGANFGSFASDPVEHVGETDTEVQVIKFARAAEDKKDIIMMNCPAHATMTSSAGTTMLSADYPSAARIYVEQNSDSLAAFFIAAAGNQVPSSKLYGEKSTSDHLLYGQWLGQYVLDIMNDMTQAEGDAVNLKTYTYTGKMIKEGIERLDEAKAVKEIWETVGRGTTEGKKAAQDAGFQSVYEVSAIINRASYPETMDMDLRVMSIGDISLIFAPFEMFGETGIDIKDRSPYGFTFVITCSEGAKGYIPTETGFEIGSYESHVTRYERGTDQKVADTFVDLLTELKGAE